MGIIKAATGSVSGVMADQWLEIYTCEGMPNDTLAMRGVKKTDGKSANTKGEDTVISDGSLVIVHDGQCALAVDRGEIIGEYYAGENTYHSDRSKSIFHKGGFKGVVKQSWERFGYGGVSAVYQVIMYIDLKEHHGNPFSVTRAVNIKDRHSLTQMDINVTLSGMYSFRVTDPVTFYQRVCGKSTGTVTTKLVLPQLTAEFNAALAMALAQLSREGAISPTDISSDTDALSEKVTAMISQKWEALRGFAIVSVAIVGVDISPKDMALLQGLERDKAFTEPTMAAAHITGAQGDAMRTAAGNPAGGGIGVVAAVGAERLFGQQEPSIPAQWVCSCGSVNRSKFCPECGKKRE